MKPLWLLALSVVLAAPTWAQSPVTVHVVNEAKAPVANATVEATLWGEEGANYVTASTDAQGNATLSLPEKPQKKKAIGRVIVYRPGFAPADAAINRDHFEFQLFKGTSWKGKVVKENGEPIEGAKVAVTIVRSKVGQKPYISLDGEKMKPLFTVSTEKDGTFQINDIPLDWTINFGVEHPRYAAGSGWGVNPADDKTITLPPGASARGQVLDDHGAPLVDATLYAQAIYPDDGWGTAKTDKEGRFQIDSLKSGNYNIIVDLTRDAKLIVPAAASVRMKAGENVEIPTFKATPGVVVHGTVVDRATRKPLAGAGIGLHGPHRPESGAAVTTSRPTKEDGRFEARVLPGRNMFYLYSLPEGYMRGNDQNRQFVEIGEAAPEDLVFALQPKPVITGTFVDENNRPMAAGLKLWGDTEIKSDDTGKWQWSPETDGPFQFGPGEDDKGYFELVSPLVIKLPVVAPLVVKMRKKPWQTLSGRVVDTQGQPVGGATIRASFFIEVGDDGALNSSERQATTDAQGRFVLPKIRATDAMRTVEVVAEKGGYAFQTGGEVSKNGLGWQISDFVFASLNHEIEGTTMAGAHVVAAGRETVADPQGHFSFKELSTGEATVFAAKEGQFGQAAANEGQPLHLDLKPLKAQGVDLELGRQIWRDTVRDVEGKDYYAASWLKSKLSALEAGDIEALRQAAKEPPTPDHDWQLAERIEKMAPQLQKSNQLSVLDEILPGIATREIRLQALLDAVIATGDETLGRRALAEAPQVFQTKSPDLNWREWNLYRVAVVTEKLNGGAAGLKALDAAINWTIAHRPEKSYQQGGQVTEPGRDLYLEWEAKTVALGSPALLKHLIEAIDPTLGINVQALSDAIPVVAQTHGVEAALPLLDDLLQMPKPDFTGQTSHTLNSEPEWAFGQTARRLIPYLGEKSPQRALELAKRVTTKEHRVRALASAAQFQTGTAAVEIWREVVQNATTSDSPRFAAQAWEKDHRLGEELFQVAFEKSASAMNRSWNRGNAWPFYAFYYVRVDAATARLILEREWEKSRQNKYEGAQGIAMAMSAIDANRAVEMANQIPDKNFASPEARRKIGQYLQTSEELRRDFPFDRWGASDTWEAGQPEW